MGVLMGMAVGQAAIRHAKSGGPPTNTEAEDRKHNIRWHEALNGNPARCFANRKPCPRGIHGKNEQEVWSQIEKNYSYSKVNSGGVTFNKTRLKKLELKGSRKLTKIADKLNRFASGVGVTTFFATVGATLAAGSVDTVPDVAAGPILVGGLFVALGMGLLTSHSSHVLAENVEKKRQEKFEDSTMAKPPVDLSRSTLKSVYYN